MKCYNNSYSVKPFAIEIQGNWMKILFKTISVTLLIFELNLDNNTEPFFGKF